MTEKIGFIIFAIFVLIFVIKVLFGKHDPISEDKSKITPTIHDIHERSNNYPVNTQNAPTLSVGDWLINYLIITIPIVGIIFLIMWAIDDNNKSRRNWATAMLIISLIGTIAVIFFYRSAIHWLDNLL
jgi:hypothetical protein